MKPLGHKAYGSIPHLPNSRLGPGDYCCHEGQARIATEKARDRHDRVIVTEKLDGSNVAVANVGGVIEALGRSGYRAASSPHEQHQIFAAWVRSRDWSALPLGYRVSGEWLQMAHGTIYEVTDPLIGFDVFDVNNKRIPHDAARVIMADLGIPGAHILSDGAPMSVPDAIAALGPYGHHGAKEAVEGAVWRIERKGAFDFLCKYVRPDKIDGKYFPQISGKPEVSMWRMGADQ